MFSSKDNDIFALPQLPVDLRLTLSNNIYVVGGTAMLPGLAHRLRVEIVKRLMEAQVDETRNRVAMIALSFPRVGPGKLPVHLLPLVSVNEGRPIDTIVESLESTGDESYLSSSEVIQGANSIQNIPKLTLESKAMLKRGKEREKFQCAPLSSMASHVAVLNDHAPRIDSEGLPVGGIAPSFPVNLSSWIGASLMGSLRIEAIDQKSREGWDEEQEAIEAAKASKGNKKKDHPALERPGLGIGRGSFLGSAGGLDLGTYGPLSAGARNKFSSPRSPPLS